MNKKEYIAIKLVFWLIIFLLPESEAKDKLKVISVSFSVGGICNDSST